MTAHYPYQFIAKSKVESCYQKLLKKVNQQIQLKTNQYSWSRGTALPSSLAMVSVKSPLISDDIQAERNAVQSVRPLLSQKRLVVNAISALHQSNDALYLVADVQHFEPSAIDNGTHITASLWLHGKLSADQVDSLNTYEKSAYHQLLLAKQEQRAERIKAQIPVRCVQITRNRLASDPFSLSIDTLSQYTTPRSIFAHLPGYQKKSIEQRAERELKPKPSPSHSRKDFSNERD